MVIRSFGGPEVFQERELEKPSPGVGEVLVRVVASGTNPVEAKIRAASHWAQIEPPAVLGYDVSGVVEEVGPGVEDFEPGDEVFYTAEIVGNQLGSYAEYTVASASIVAPKPATLSHLQAAAVPLAGGTAWEGIVRRLQVRPGETVLVNGGAGGVGHFAVQFARISGARVLASAGSQNQQTLRELGAEPIDYRERDPFEAALEATAGAGVDAVLDLVGGDSVPRALPAIRPFGRVGSVLAISGDLSAAYRRNQAVHGIFLTRERARLEEMTPLLEWGGVEPLIERVLPLQEVAEAHRRLDSGHGRGKVVLEVASPGG